MKFDSFMFGIKGENDVEDEDGAEVKECLDYADSSHCVSCSRRMNCATSNNIVDRMDVKNGVDDIVGVSDIYEADGRNNINSRKSEKGTEGMVGVLSWTKKTNLTIQTARFMRTNPTTKTSQMIRTVPTARVELTGMTTEISWMN